jgi:hypothetical protein
MSRPEWHHRREQAMAEQDRDDLTGRLAKFGWRPHGQKTYPDGGVEVKLRRVSDTAGEEERSIFGTDVNDAIRKEVEQLEAEGIAGQP